MADVKVARVVTALIDVFIDDIGGARMWLYSPNPSLDGRQPIELLETGEADRVLQAIGGLAAGVMG
jgi:putative toxin-antitoxin system antitoxin component (TIGR02293 family)